MDLVEQVLALHDALVSARVPHAFGGALALAYWTEEPRGTRDIDCNVFVPAADNAVVLAALPPDVEVPAGTAEQIAIEGQVRLWWNGTPLDLFFDYIRVHRAAAAGARVVPLAGRQIPVLGPVELVVFKAVFDRTKHWADIESVLSAGSVTGEELHQALVEVVGSDDPRVTRLLRTIRRTDSGN